MNGVREPVGMSTGQVNSRSGKPFDVMLGEAHARADQIIKRLEGFKVRLIGTTPSGPSDRAEPKEPSVSSSLKELLAKVSEIDGLTASLDELL